MTFFESLHLQYDVVCFVETINKESPDNLPGYIKPIVLCSKRSKKKRGRSSGGLLLYYKPFVSKFMEIVKLNDFSIWLTSEKLSR